MILITEKPNTWESNDGQSNLSLYWSIFPYEEAIYDSLFASDHLTVKTIMAQSICSISSCYTSERSFSKYWYLIDKFRDKEPMFHFQVQHCLSASIQ